MASSFDLTTDTVLRRALDPFGVAHVGHPQEPLSRRSFQPFYLNTVFFADY